MISQRLAGAIFLPPKALECLRAARSPPVKALFWLNAALLAAHEVDAASWREWELLGLPFGASGFVLVHVAAFLLLLWGHAAVVEERRSAIGWSLALAVCGLAAAAFHGWRLWEGRPEFRSWTSVGLLAAIAAVSLVQLAAARFEQRVRQRSAGGGRRVFLDLKVD
jgi:hypothetical protein